MKFTINKVAVDSITVEFDNKSTAVVPVQKGMTQDQLKERIASFNNVAPTPFDKVGDIDLKEGTEYEYVIPTLDEEISYAEARAANYPAVGKQLDALYWEREGDDTQRKAYDAKIKNVKEKIPKGKTYKRSEVDSLLD
jgi:hypothetical protein